MTRRASRSTSSTCPARRSVLLALASLTGCSATGDVADPTRSRSRCCCPTPRPRATRRFDRPYFEDKLADARRLRGALLQRRPGRRRSSSRQAEAALASGVKVLVLDPVDAAAAASIVAAANAQGVPVIAYDRFIEGGDLAYYVSFDNEKIGVLQAHGARRQARRRRTRPAASSWSTARPPTSNAGAVQGGRAQRHRRQRLSRCSPSSTPPTGAPTRRRTGSPSQITQFGGQHRRHLRRERRHGQRRDRGPQRRERHARSRSSPGRTPSSPAIQRIVVGRPVHDDLQGDASVEAELAAEVAVQARHRREGRPARPMIDGAPATLLADRRRHDRQHHGRPSSPTASTRSPRSAPPTYAAACAAAGIK